MSESIIQNVVSHQNSIAENQISETIFPDEKITGTSPDHGNIISSIGEQFSSDATDIEFCIGMSIKIFGKKYRCLNVTPVYLTLCEMECTRLNIFYPSLNSIQRYLVSGDAEKILENPIILDTRDISEEFRDELEYRRDVINRIVNEYGPDFFDLNGKSPKPLLNEILNEKRISRKPLHRLLLRYLQSGMSDYALVDKRWTRYIIKPVQNGANTENVPQKSKMQIHFDWGINYLKEKKGKASIYDGYLKLSWEFYSETVVEDGKVKQRLLPKNNRPTYKQFLYYFNKNVSQKEKEIIKTSQTEYRNNKRLLKGSSETGVYGAYDMLEMDACEVPLSLIDLRNNTVGRPIIYVLIDVATRAIVAATASFENNSIKGLMNCLCNLNEDKRTLLINHGIEDFDSRAWLTGYKPRAIRMDNGSDFRSNYVGDVFKSFGIERILVSPGSGSLKGVIERSFRDYREKISPSTVNCGLISADYGSKHHKEAMLTINEFKTMLYRWVLCHNTIIDQGIDLSRDMIREEIPPVPCEVMEYLFKAKTPLRFPSGDEFLMKILARGTAKIKREGFIFNKLKYFPKNNPKLIDLIEECRASGTETLNISYDPLCIDNIFYVMDGQLVQIPLNDQADRQNSYLGMTFAEIDQMFEKKKKIIKTEIEKTEQARAQMLSENDLTVENAAQTKYANTKNMRENRSAEKQRVNRNAALSKRFSSDVETQPERPALPEKTKQLPAAPNESDIKKQAEKKKKLTREEKLKKIGDLDGFIKE